MSFFGKLVRTAVNTALLPVAIAKDVATLGGVCTGELEPYTVQQLEKIKEEAEDD
jgi:hypothetical protein